MSLFAIDAIQEVIALLRADEAVAGLTSTVAANLAPQGSQMPYLVVSLASDQAQHTLCRDVAVGFAYVSVRAVAATVGEAKALADAACAALSGQEVEGADGTRFGVSYRSAFSYPDPARSGGAPSMNVGAVFQISYQPA